MSALLAQQLDGRCLVIAPPQLLDRDKRGSWPNVFSDFQVRQTDFVSIGKIDDLLKRDLSKYTNIFIDESHRFRNESNATYENLAQICRGKRVILVSATPLNNRPWDILSQVKLFQNGKNSTIPNLRNLEFFFSGLEKKLDGLDRQKNHELYFQTVQANARATREKVLKYLMIRRTRTEIEKYYGEDMLLQGLKFPAVDDPQALFYKFNSKENGVFDETVRLLATDFKYARYRPLTYYQVEVLARLRSPCDSEIVIVDQAPQECELLIRIKNLYCRVLLQVADKRAHALMEFGCVKAQFLFQQGRHPGACEQAFQLLD